MTYVDSQGRELKEYRWTVALKNGGRIQQGSSFHANRADAAAHVGQHVLDLVMATGLKSWRVVNVEMAVAEEAA